MKSPTDSSWPADQTLDQQTGDRQFDAEDVLANSRQYPKDEAPAACKDFGDVINLVELAG